MIKLKIDNGKRSLEVTTSGETKEWSYDILTVKLESERLEIKHKLRSPGESKLQQATPGFLRDLAAALDKEGLSGCTVDAAFQVYNIVNSQFIALTAEINKQVNESLESLG